MTNSDLQPTLTDLFHRTPVPEPWAEGDNIPWHDPEFSRRMLREHFDQTHDRASRRFNIIDQHVQWIHNSLLGSDPTRILDLGCGPGFYAHALAGLGHHVTGIDYSPASIDRARSPMPSPRPVEPADLARCSFHHADLRQLPDYTFGSAKYHLIMMLYGEFNVFCPDHIRLILERSAQALVPGGILLLEPQTYTAVQQTGTQLPFWAQATQSVFSDSPHLWLEEFFWDELRQAATTRYWVIDVATGQVTPYAQTAQAWTNDALDTLLTECGFTNPCLYPSLANAVDDAGTDLMAFVVRRT